MTKVWLLYSMKGYEVAEEVQVFASEEGASKAREVLMEGESDLTYEIEVRTVQP